MAALPPQPRLLPIDELNRLPRQAFGPALKPLFEAASPLSEALYAERPFSSYPALVDRAAFIVDRLPDDQKITIINAHPRIGAPPKLLRRTSKASYHEQGYDRDSGAESAEQARVQRELAELNEAYERRFGIRFVVFVNRRPRSEILTLLKDRLHRPREQEMTTALHDMLAIARDRLKSVKG